MVSYPLSLLELHPLRSPKCGASFRLVYDITCSYCRYASPRSQWKGAPNVNSDGISLGYSLNNTTPNDKIGHVGDSFPWFPHGFQPWLWGSKLRLQEVLRQQCGWVPAGESTSFVMLMGLSVLATSCCVIIDMDIQWYSPPFYLAHWIWYAINIGYDMHI